MPVICEKQAWEEVTYNFDFTSLLPIDANGVLTATLASIVEVVEVKRNLIAGSADLTRDNPVLSSPYVQVRYKGGTVGEEYWLTARATFSNGDKREIDGILRIIAEPEA